MNKKENFEDLTIKDLVSRYNTSADLYGNPAEFAPVKNFKDRATAISRVEAVEEALAPAKKTTKKPAAKKPAAKKPAAKKEPKKPAGRKPNFEYDPHKDGQVDPRAGTLRGDCLEMLKEGATIDELEEKMIEFRDASGKEWKITPRYRAIEILKLLNNHNGYGFEVRAEEGEDVIYAIT